MFVKFLGPSFFPLFTSFTFSIIVAIIIIIIIIIIVIIIINNALLFFRVFFFVCFAQCKLVDIQ